MQGLSGFKGQSMSGQRPAVYDPFPLKMLLHGPVNSGGSISTSFTAETGGLFQFALWGAGAADASDGGGGGALAIKTVRLGKDAVVPLVIGGPNVGARDSTATFPDSTVITAGGGADGSGSGGVGGTAGGGDINVSGVAGTAGNGGQAGSYLGYVGGLETCAPGGGGRVAGNPLAAGGCIMVFKLTD